MSWEKDIKKTCLFLHFFQNILNFLLVFSVFLLKFTKNGLF